MGDTGILADTVAVDCTNCGCALLVPTRLANEAGGPLCFQCEAQRTRKDERKRVADLTGERKTKGRDGR